MPAKTSYQTLSARIKATKTLEDLNALEKRIDKFYQAGCLTVSEYRRLDLMVFDRQTKFELAKQ